MAGGRGAKDNPEARIPAEVTGFNKAQEGQRGLNRVDGHGWQEIAYTTGGAGRVSNSTPHTDQLEESLWAPLPSAVPPPFRPCPTNTPKDYLYPQVCLRSGCLPSASCDHCPLERPVARRQTWQPLQRLSAKTKSLLHSPSRRFRAPASWMLPSPHPLAWKGNLCWSLAHSPRPIRSRMRNSGVSCPSPPAACP